MIVLQYNKSFLGSKELFGKDQEMVLITSRCLSGQVENKKNILKHRGYPCVIKSFFQSATITFISEIIRRITAINMNGNFKYKSVLTLMLVLKLFV